MCTVSFIARQRGYLLAMNRDEKRTRPAGLPPCLRLIGERAVLGPTEPGGGAWITVNDAGVAFALINWYSVPPMDKTNPVSRGTVLMAVSAHAVSNGAAALMAILPLKHLNPFRVMGVFPAEKKVVEWRWNRIELVRQDHPWQAQQFISSGWDEPQAQRVRSETFHRAQQQSSVGTIDWLRRLHRSHAPAGGPFSTCMHRPDAATVSYTDMSVSETEVRMWHRNAAPCELTVPPSLHTMARRRGAVIAKPVPV